MKDRSEKLPYILIGLLAVCLVIRAFYGFCQSDECFYISTAGRFAAGDRVFIDEWHPTQMSSLITAPIYMLYRLFVPDRSGIILFFRLLYVMLCTAEGAFVYHGVSKKQSKGAAIALSGFLMLYCHLNMATLSYYMLTFHLYTLAFLIIYCRKSDRAYIAGGICLALAVLSLPSLAVAYALVMIILLISCVFYRGLRKPLLLFSAGIFIPFVIFVVYLYASKVGIAGLLANLVNILSDSEHDRGYVQSFFMFFDAIKDAFGKIYYLSIVLVILAVTTHLNAIYRIMIKPYIFFADVILLIYYLFTAASHTGFINTAFALFVFPLFFLTERKNWYIFASLFMGGLAVSATYCFSSYSDLYVLSVGHGISAAGSIILLDDFTEDSRRMLRYISWAVLAASMIITGVLRFTYVYRDAAMDELKARVMTGPAAGLITTAEHRQQYEKVLEAVKKYNGGDRVLFTRILPWGYIVSDMRVAAPDTWRHELSSERLSDYYDADPKRLPDVVFVLDAEIGSYETAGDVEADPAPNENEFSGKLAEKLIAEYEEHIEPGCTVYTRR